MFFKDPTLLFLELPGTRFGRSHASIWRLLGSSGEPLEPHWGPKWPQEVPRRCPRGSHMGSKRSQKGDRVSKWLPGRLQAPKKYPKWPQNPTSWIQNWSKSSSKSSDERLCSTWFCKLSRQTRWTSGMFEATPAEGLPIAS